MSKIVDLIENHISDDELNIGFLAKSMGMSHSALYKKIGSTLNLMEDSKICQKSEDRRPK